MNCRLFIGIIWKVTNSLCHLRQSVYLIGIAMSSDYKGKNVFGADVYEGKDGSIHHNKYDADRTYHNEYKSEEESYTFSPPGTNDAFHQAQQTPTYSGSSSSTPPMTPEAKSKILSIIILLAGSWAIPWIFVTFQHGYSPAGFLYQIVSAIALVINWPGKLLLPLFTNGIIPNIGILYFAIPVANFIWLCLLGKACIKKSTLKTLFGMKLKNYTQLSWLKVSLILLLSQIIVALSAKL